MQKPKFNWEDARYFLAVARVGTVGKAAQSLGVSNITLSRHLAHLQSRTRSQLLIRHSKGFKLSEEGHRLMELHVITGFSHLLDGPKLVVEYSKSRFQEPLHLLKQAHSLLSQ